MSLVVLKVGILDRVVSTPLKHTFSSFSHSQKRTPEQELEVSVGKYTLPMENPMFPGKMASKLRILHGYISFEECIWL